MNKIWLLGTVVCMILAFAACKPKQSAYKTAYEQAKERETTAPLDDFSDDEFAETDSDEFADDEFEEVSKPRTSYDDDDDLNVATRQEHIDPYQGNSFANLGRFSVVIGSFRNSTNAQALKERMQREGYNAVIAQNEMGMLRVIVSSSENKRDALYSRDAFRSKYYPNFQDAWILERYY